MGMFTDAKPAAPKTGKGKKAPEARIHMPGLEGYAALCSAIDALEAQKKVLEGQIKAEMGEMFVRDGCAAQSQPANYKAEEGLAKASLQLRLRSSKSILSEAECELLSDENIPYDLSVEVEDTFVINPEFATDMKLLAKVEEALKTVKGLPEDFIQKQVGKSHYVATKESIAAVFKKPVKKASVLLPVVTTLAIRANIEGDYMPIIDKLMEGVDTDSGTCEGEEA